MSCGGKHRLVQLEDPRSGTARPVRVVANGIARRRPEPPDRGKPSWLRAALPSGSAYVRLRDLVERTRLHTVCREAMCPNTAECWNRGTVTIMILGGVCTRACRFCAVDTGNPRGWIDRSEPENVAEAVRELGIRYAVLTSVDRDDLSDGGATHFADVVRAIKRSTPQVKVEALTPDFRGDRAAVDAVLDSGIDVFAHNVETVRRLTPTVRDVRATYDQSLAVLRHARRAADESQEGLLTKSSLMLGLGETDEDVETTMLDLRAAGVDVLTIGQYLRPTRHHLPVARYVTPAEFDAYRESGIRHGFREVFSGPLVRSSYRAERVFRDADRG